MVRLDLSPAQPTRNPPSTVKLDLGPTEQESTVRLDLSPTPAQPQPNLAGLAEQPIQIQPPAFEPLSPQDPQALPAGGVQFPSEQTAPQQLEPLRFQPTISDIASGITGQESGLEDLGKELSKQQERDERNRIIEEKAGTIRASERPSVIREVGLRLNSGINSTAASIENVKALAADAFGSEGAKEFFKERAERFSRIALEDRAGLVSNTKQIQGAGDVLRFASGALAEQIPNLAVLATGGGGLGTFLSAAALETGSIYGDTDNVGSSIAHGAVSGILEALPISRLFKKAKIGRAASLAIVDRIRKSADGPLFEKLTKLAGGALKETGTQAGLEGLTEDLQTIVSRHAQAWENENLTTIQERLEFAATSPEALEERKQARIAGATVGGILGGASQLSTGASEINQFTRERQSDEGQTIPTEQPSGPVVREDQQGELSGRPVPDPLAGVEAAPVAPVGEGVAEVKPPVKDSLTNETTQKKAPQTPPIERTPEKGTKPPVAKDIARTEPEAPASQRVGGKKETIQPIDSGEPGPPVPESTQKVQLQETPPQTFSGRKEQVKADRESWGLDGLPSPERRAWGKDIARARELEIPERAVAMSAAIVANPKPISSIEFAGLVERTTQLDTQMKKLESEMGPLTDPADIAFNSAQQNRIEEDFNLITEALDLSGQEGGRGQAIRRMVVDRNMDILSVLNRAKSKKLKELTPLRRREYQTLVKKYEQRGKDIAKLQKRVDNITAEKTIRRGASQMRRKKTKQQMDTDLAKSVARVSELLKSGCA